MVDHQILHALAALEQSLAAAFVALRGSWFGQREDVIALLADWPKLSRQRYRPDQIEKAAAQADIALGADLPPLPLPEEVAKALAKFGSRIIADSLNKGGEMPEHPLFELFREFLDAHDALVAAYALRLRDLRRRLIAWCDAELPRRKAQQGLRAYDDLLLDLQRALADAARGEGLGRRPRARRPGARPPVEVVGVTTLLGPGGAAVPDGQPRSRGLDPDQERRARRHVGGHRRAGDLAVGAPVALDGTFLGDLPVPDAFRPTSATHGVRQNLAFEAAAVAPNGRHLFVGMEGALAQDGPPATLDGGSPARILRHPLPAQPLDRQYVYVTDPVAEPSVPPTAFAVNGLVELLPFNNQFMLSMERSFSVGAPGTGNTIKLYGLAFPGAGDVNGLDSIAAVLGDVRPLRKALLLDLRTLGIPLDNVEGMTIGPDLPDGRRSLLLVSDNNFAVSQFTQFLLFALD